MALLFPRKPAIFNQGQLRVANIYSRPALAPFYTGVRGFGQARRTSTDAFANTLRSFATTPFAVNSESYMDMIRQRYGYNDKNIQNTLGVIGGVVGAGTAAAIQSGLFFGTRRTPLQISRRNAQAGVGFRPYTPDQVKFIDAYNTQSKLVADSLSQVNKATDVNKVAVESLKKAEETWKKTKYLSNTSTAKRLAKESLDNAKKAAFKAARDLDNANSIRNTAKLAGREAASKLAASGVRIADAAVEAGTSIGRRVAGLTPFVGLGIDTLSLGLSTAGLVQDIKSGDVGNIVLSGVEVLGDAISVTGSALEFTPLLPIGSLISGIGAVISIGASALRVGFNVGQTVGRSLTPSGLKAQQLFAENISANISARPLSTIAAITMQVGVPFLIGLAGRKYDPKAGLINRLLYGLPNFLGENVLGNQIRAGLTMFGTQLITPLTAAIDEKLPTFNPDGADFVSAISLFGDIQDNLFGATRTKSILLGLAANDPKAKTDAIARAWGYSDKPAYVLTAADIIESTDGLKSAPPIVKSILGVAGEIILDPRNFNEMVQGRIRQERTASVSDFITREIQRVEIAKLSGLSDVGIIRGIDKLVDGTNRGIFSGINKESTTRLVQGAVDSYMQGGAKALNTYLLSVGQQKYKGIKVGNLTTTLTEQIKVFESFVKDVVEGTYQSPITLNNLTARKLLNRIKEQERLLKEAEKTGSLPAEKLEAEKLKYQKFMAYVSTRYGEDQLDVVVKRMFNDFNIKPDVGQVVKYLNNSDAFAKYMDFTDTVNSGIITILNPIGKLLQMGEVRFVRWFNESTRSSMTTQKERMRTLTDVNKVISNFSKAPKIDEIIKRLEVKSTPEQQLENLLDPLDPNKPLNNQQENTVEEIRKEVEADPELKEIRDLFNENQNNTLRLVEELKKRQKGLEDNRSQFKIGVVDYKIGTQAPITIDETNYKSYYDRLEELRKLRETQKLTKQEQKEFDALVYVFTDYELAISGNKLIQTAVTAYQQASIILNQVNSKADDYLLKVLQSLYVFKQYVNTYIPQKATVILENKKKRLEAIVKSNNEKINEQTIFIKNKEKEFAELTKLLTDNGTLEVAKRDQSSDYSKLFEVINNAKKNIESLEASNKDFTDVKIAAVTKELEQLVADIKSGKAKNIKNVVAFDSKKHNETMDLLDAIARVNYLNGIEFEFEYEDPKTKQKKKVVINESQSSRKAFITLAEIPSETINVGIKIKDNFSVAVNRVVNQYLGKDVFQDIMNYNHKLFDLSRKEWNSLSEKNKIKTIAAFIHESELTDQDKKTLLTDTMLKKIYVTINSNYRNKTETGIFISADQVSPQILYRYVIQEQFKLYKGSTNPESNRNPIVQAFVEASKIIKEVDDSLSKSTEQLDKIDFEKKLLVNYREVFERVFKSTPIYRYVKGYLYDYLQHDSTKLTLFQRSTINELLPDSIDKYDIMKAFADKDVASSLVNNVQEAPLTKLLMGEYDITELSKLQPVLFKINTKGILEKEEEEKADRVIEAYSKSEEERLSHKEEQQTVKQVTDDASHDGTGFKNTAILNRIYDEDFNPLVITSELESNILTIPFGDKDIQNRQAKLGAIVNAVLKSDKPLIDLNYFTVKLNMRKLIYEKDGKVTSILQYLKDNKRSTVEYEEAVRVLSYRLAWLYTNYKDRLEFEGIEINNKDTTESIQEKITALYLKEGNINVRISTKDNDKNSNYTYGALFKSELIKKARKYIKTNNLNISTDTSSVINFLLNNKDTTLLNTIVGETNDSIRRIMFNNKNSLVFLNTLNSYIVELRDVEKQLKRSISKQNAELNPAIRKKALLKSKEIKSIFQDLKDVSLNKNPDEYNHVFFRILHLVKDYYTEDYASKTILNDFNGFNNMNFNKNGDLIIEYKTDSMKQPINYTVFDLLFIHGISRSDFNNLLSTIQQRMAVSNDAKIVGETVAAARVEFENVINEFGLFITHNALTIDKEIFMRQEGATKEMYELFTDPVVNELRKRLNLTTSIMEVEEGNDIDFNKFYDKRFRTYGIYIQDNLNKTAEDIEKSKTPEQFIKFFGYDKNNKKVEMFKINMFDADGKLRNRNTVLLLTLLELSKQKDNDLKIITPENTKQSAYINPEQIKTVIRSVFFKDIKAVAGKASNTDIAEYEEKLSNAKEELETHKGNNKNTTYYKRTLNNLENRVKIFEDIIKEAKKINATIDINPSTDEGFNIVYNRMLNDQNLAEAYFNNRIDTNADRYVMGEVSKDNYRLVRKTDVLDSQRVDQGIPKLNNYLINYVFGNNDAVFNKRVKERLNNDPAWLDIKQRYFIPGQDPLPIVTKEGTVIFVVPDNQWSFKGQEDLATLIKRLANNDYKEYDVYEVVILSETKYKEINTLKENYVKNKQDYPTVDTFKVDPTKPIFPEFINIQGSKNSLLNSLVDGWLQDIDLISTVKNSQDKLNLLREFYKTLYSKNNLKGLVPVYKDYNEGVNLFNTDTFKRMQKDAELNLMFYDFYEAIDSEKFDLEYVGTEFFKAKYIDKNYKLDNIENDPELNPMIVTQLKEQKIWNKVVDALRYMQSEYGHKDLKLINFNNTFNQESITNLIRLKNMVTRLVKFTERTNQKVYNRILPILKEHLKNELSEDVTIDYIVRQLSINDAHSSNITKDIVDILENPFSAKNTDEVLNIFEKVGKETSELGLSNFVIQQYYLSRNHKQMKEARENHKRIRKILKEGNLNYLNYTSIRGLYRDFSDGKISGDELYTRLKDYVPLDDKTIASFTEVANKIWQANPGADGYTSSERIAQHLIYNYVIKSYLVSIKQFMDRNIAGFANQQNAISYISYLKNIKSSLEAPGPALSPYEKQVIKDVNDIIELNPPEKKIRYKHNDEHFTYRGNSTDEMYSYSLGNVQDLKKSIENKKRIISDKEDAPTIDENIVEYIFNKFGVALDDKDAVEVIKNAGQVLLNTSKYLYGKTDNKKLYIESFKEIQLTTDSLNDLKKKMLEDGYNEAQIEVIIALGKRTDYKNSKVIVPVSFTAEEVKKIFSNEKIERKTDAYIESVYNIRRDKNKVKTIKKQSQLDFKETINVNSIDLLQKSPRFLEYFRNVIRNKSDETSTELIYKVLSNFGINRDEAQGLLEQRYNSIEHFLNAHAKRNQELTKSKDIHKAILLMQFVNYHKRKFIELDLKKTNLNKESIRDVLDYELIREKSNTKNIQTININEIFGDGNSMTNSINFYLNRGFNILNQINPRVTFINDRLNNIILDESNIKDNPEYNAQDRGIYFKDNNIKLVTSGIQSNIYEPYFKDSDAGFIGSRNYELLLMRKEFVSDMIAESTSKTWEVGSASKIYNDIRRVWTKLLERLKTNFISEEFIRVRDVTTSIQTLKGNKLYANFFVKYYNDLVTTSRNKYLIDNRKAKYTEGPLKGQLKGTDVLLAEFNLGLQNDIEAIKQLAIDNNKLVELDDQSIKAILGFIYTQRFETSNYNKQMSKELSKYATEQLAVDVEYKQYKFKTINSVIRRIVNQPNSNNNVKREQLAALQGKTFDTLTEEQKNTIINALRIHDFIKASPTFFDPNRWYDTFDYAYTEKAKAGAPTTISMQREINSARDIQETIADRNKLEKIRNRSIDYINKEATQSGLLGNVEGVDYYNYDKKVIKDSTLLERSVDNVINILNLRIEKDNEEFNKAQLDFKKKKVEFINNLFIVYPGLKQYYLEAAFNKKDAEISKLLEAIKNLNNKTNTKVVAEYRNYANEVEKITEIEESNVYQALNLVDKVYQDLVGTGINKEDALTTVFSFFKEEFLKYEINSVDALKQVYKYADDTKLWERLKTLRDNRDQRGKKLRNVKSNEYKKYLREIQRLETRLAIEEVKKFKIETGDVDEIDFSIDVLDQIINAYNKKSTLATGLKFKEVASNINFDTISDFEKKNILKHHGENLSKATNFLRKSYERIRKDNLSFGLAAKKELTGGPGKEITLPVLLKYIEEEYAILQNHLENLKDKLVIEIPTQKDLPALENEEPFKNKLYIEVAKRLAVAVRESDFKRALSPEELAYENKRIEDLIKDKSTLEQSNFLLTIINNPKNYNVRDKVFGSVSINRNGLLDNLTPEQQKYAEALLDTVNSGLLNTYNKFVNTNIVSITEQLKRTEALSQSALLEKDILESVDKAKVIDRLDKSTKLFNSLLKDIDPSSEISVDQSTTKELLHYLKAEKNSNTMLSIIKSKKEKLLRIEKLETFKKRLLSIDKDTNKIKDLDILINNKKETFEKTKAETKSFYNKELEVAGDRLRNIDVFKHYYKLKDKSNQEVLEEVLKLVTKGSKGWTVEKLKKFITDRGDFELHNSVVDSLITHLNYKFQRGDEEHVVVDVETYRLNGEEVPYQMTMLYFTKDGELKVNDIYINSSLFYDGVNEDGSYKASLQTFYERQRDKIWGKEWEEAGLTLTKDALNIKAKEKMNSLIERIRTVKNNDNFIQAFIQITGRGNDFKIVAHNGFRFDFNIIEKFVSTVGNNLLVNEYYRNLNESKSLDTIYENINKNNLNDDQITDEYILALQKEYDKTIEDLNVRGEDMRIKELEIIERKVTVINKKLLSLKVSRRLKQLSMRVGYIVNDDIKKQILDVTDGAMADIVNMSNRYLTATNITEKDLAKKDLIARFMEGINPEVNNKSAYNIISKYVNNLIDAIEKDYKSYMDGTAVIKYGSTRKNSTTRTSITDNTFQFLGIKQYDEDYEINIAEQNRVIDLAIQGKKDLIETLKQGKTTEQIITSVEKDILSYKEQVQTIKDEMKKIQDKGNALNFNDILDKMLDKSKALSQLNKEYQANINIALNNVEDSINDTIGSDSLSSLRVQKDVNHRNLIKRIESLRTVAQRIKEGVSVKDLQDVLKTVLDERVVDVINDPSKLIQAKESIDVELKKLEASQVDPTKVEVKAYLQTILDSLKNEHRLELKVTEKDLLETLKRIINIKELNLNNIKIVDEKIFIDGKQADLKQLIDFNRFLTTDKVVENPKVFETHREMFFKFNRIVKDYVKFNNFLTVELDNIINNKLNGKTYLEVFTNEINKRYDALLNAKEFLNKYKPDSLKNLDQETLASMYETIVTDITGQERVLETLKAQSIVQLITGLEPSDRMSDERYNEVASHRLNIKEINETSNRVKALNLGVWYDDPEKANDINVIRNIPNEVFSKRFVNEDTGTTYIYTVHDDTYNEANQIVFNSLGTEATITLRYGYKENILKYSGGASKGYQVQEKNIVVELGKKRGEGYKYGTEDLKDLLKIFYFKNKEDNKHIIIPGVKQSELAFEDGKDSSKEAIKVLIEFALAHANTFSTKVDAVKNAEMYKEKLDRLNKIYDDTLTHEKFSVNNKYLKVINISEIIRNQFLSKLRMFTDLERKNLDIKNIYVGIYNKVTARYKALEPGSIVNQINSDYTYDYNIDKIDHGFLEEHNIALDLNSEGSAGAVFKYKPRYALNFPFVLQTNSIRTMLSSKHILAKYTTVGLFNNIYRDIPDEFAPGKKLLSTFIEGKYISDPLKNKLIRKSGNNNTQIFMPNVMSPELYQAFKDDSQVHQFGVSLPVAFTKDPRIPLDVIAIDADFARQMGWGDGNKTWLGLHYGFKGAVRFIPDLYKTYGSYFAASADSVFSRGTAGVYGEMLFNYIRSYLINETDNTGASVVPQNTKQYFDQIKDVLVKEFKEEINQDNILLLDNKKTNKYFKIINEALSKLNEFKGKDVDTLYQRIMLQKVEGSPQITVPAYTRKRNLKYEDINKDFDLNNEFVRKEVKTVLDNATFVKGLIYVYADHENSAQSMQTITKINTAGKLIYNVVDANNSVIKGLSLSPTVMNAIFSKIGKDNLFKVFKPDDTALVLLSEVRSKGFAKVIKDTIQLTNEDIINDQTIEEYYTRLNEAYTNKLIHQYVYKQGLSYIHLLHQRNVNAEKENKVGYNFEIEKLITNTESNVFRKMYGAGKESAYYRSTFKRWDGIRQQFLADVSLDIGEIVLSRDGWEAVEKKHDPKTNPLIKTEELTDAKKVKEYKQSALMFDNYNQRVDYLNSRGIFEKNNKELYIAIKKDGVSYSDIQSLKLNQSYTYLLSARSPVQDYGAVPVFKAIGYSTSYAASVNVYAYKMMGADNDGDTFGMALLRLDSVEGKDAPLKELLATNLNYYSFDEEITDKNYNQNTVVRTYIDEQNSEMFGKKKDSSKLPDYDFVGDDVVYNMKEVDLISYKFTRNQTGKNTFNGDIRPDKSYTEIELYRLIDQNILNQLVEKVEKQLTAIDTTDIVLLRKFVNVFIRSNNEGSDIIETADDPFTIDDYLNNEKLLNFYNKNKTAIDTLYTIEQGLNKGEFKFGTDIVVNKNLFDLYKDVLKDDAKFLLDKTKPEYNEYYEYLVNYILSKQLDIGTTSRVRASKNGVNYAGNKRKDQFISSHISMYPNINKSKQGFFWKAIGAADDNGEVTIRSLIHSLFNDTKGDTTNQIIKNRKAFDSVDNLKNYIQTTSKNTVIKNPPAYLEYYMKDYDMLLQDVVNIVNKYYNGINELYSLGQFISKQNSLTVKDLVDFIKTSSKQEDPVLKQYLKYFTSKEVNPETKLDGSYVDEIGLRYFNNPVSYKEFKSNKNTAVKFMSGYLDQYIIERVAQNNMSNLIQETISVSKHDGQDTNANSRYIRYKEKVDKFTTERSNRKVIIGTDLEHVFGMAINVDRTITEKLNIRFDKVSNQSINSKYFEEKGGRFAVQESYTNPDKALQAIQQLTKQRAKILLLGNMYMPDVLVSRLYKNIEVLNKALNEPRNYLVFKDELEKAIRFFNLQGIPFYRLVTFLEDALSIKQVVNERYVNDKRIDITKLGVINNSNNILSLMYRLRAPDYKTKFDSRYSKETEFYNFFNNLNDIDAGFIYTDGEGNRRVLKENDDPDQEESIQAVDDVSNAAGNDGTNNSAVIQKDFEELSQTVTNEVTDQVKDKLEYANFGTTIKTYEDLLGDIRLEISLLLKTNEEILEKENKTKKNIKDLNLKTSLQYKIANNKVKKIITGSASRKQLSAITDLNNLYKENQSKLEAYKEQILTLQNKLDNDQKQIQNLERYKNFFKEGKDTVSVIENEIKELEIKKQELNKKALQHAVTQNIGGGVLLLRSSDGGNIGDGTISKPRYLTQEVLDQYKDRTTFAMANEITLLTNMIDGSSEASKKMSLNIVYNFAKKEQGNYRLVQMTPPLDDEGRYKSIVNRVRRFIPGKDTEDILFKSFTKKELEDSRFKTIEEVEEWQSNGGKVVFEGKVYNKFDDTKNEKGILNLILRNNMNLTPTYKEIIVRSEEELRELYESSLKNGLVVGFIDLNTWMQSMEKVYNPTKLNSKFERFIFNAQIISKNLSKFSAAFLFRNLTDTVYQLFSNAQILPKAIDSKTYINSTINALEVWNLYEKYSNEHSITIMNAGMHYEDLLEMSKIPTLKPEIVNNKINILKDSLDSYIEIGKSIQQPDDRISFRLKEAERVLRQLNQLDVNKLAEGMPLLKQVVTFISNIKFGEFIDMYDNREINGRWVAGLRVDNKDKNNNVITTYVPLEKSISQYKDYKESMLKQLSYFMNTAATQDYLRKDRFELLPEYFQNYRGYDNKDYSSQSYEDNIRQYNKQKNAWYTYLNPVKAYERINNKIENAARITNFFYNILIHNKTMDQAVLSSLKSWFNYGMRSPLEQRLLADIPFISFPIRSIGNWIDRINNPRWWRFMSDFIDGWYGQYIDEEDKDYNDYIKYQMRNGWIPITKNFGLRIGNGAFDIMNLIYNTEESIQGRLSPILRGVKTLVEKRNVFEAVNQLATLGLIGRIANTVSGVSDMNFRTNLRQQAAQVPLLQNFLETRPATAGTTYRGFAYDIFNFDKYTPRRYRYSRNGRYAKYENIYKDYFNKYGRFRSNAASPYRLVKNIQWRQYVRYRQSQAIIGRR